MCFARNRDNILLKRKHEMDMLFHVATADPILQYMTMELPKPETGYAEGQLARFKTKILMTPQTICDDREKMRRPFRLLNFRLKGNSRPQSRLILPAQEVPDSLPPAADGC